jgi:hypothetical protein
VTEAGACLEEIHPLFEAGCALVLKRSSRHFVRERTDRPFLTRELAGMAKDLESASVILARVVGDGPAGAARDGRGCRVAGTTDGGPLWRN